MRFFKSETAKIFLCASGIGVTILLFYGLPVVLAQAVANHPVRQIEAKQVYSTRAAMVNLPPGQRFMYIIPKDEAAKIGGAKPDRNIYVTYRYSDHGLGYANPRVISFLQPSNTPGGWDEVLYIQER